MTVTPGQKEKHYAACFKPVYRSVTKTCTRRLVVTAEASCRVGETQTASNSDFGGLGEDAVPGADTLTATSVCSADGPELRLTVNSQPEVTVTARTNIFETVVNITGGQARLAGDVSCTKADCIAQLKMTVLPKFGHEPRLPGRSVFCAFPSCDSSRTPRRTIGARHARACECEDPVCRFVFDLVLGGFW